MALTLALMVLAASACAPPPQGESTDPRLKPTYGDDGRLTQLTFDRDGNGQIDTWGYMDGRRVVRVERDENGDGKVDRWDYHRAPAGCVGADCGNAAPSPLDAPDKTLERIERASRDGRQEEKVSRWEFFADGIRVRAEEDTNADGKVDKWETYTNGTLTLIALDTQHRGTPDRRVVYDADGTFLRLEADPSGSGTFTPITQ